MKISITEGDREKSSTAQRCDNSAWFAWFLVTKLVLQHLKSCWILLISVIGLFSSILPVLKSGVITPSWRAVFCFDY